MTATELFPPTRRRVGPLVVGRKFLRVRRTPPYLAFVELPSKRVVTAHTYQRARFSGWVGLRAPVAQPRRAVARLRLGDGPWDEVPMRAERPDVLAALGPDLGFVAARGFSHYVDLPPMDASLPVEVEFDVDGLIAHAGTFELSPEADLGLLETFSAVPPPMVQLAHEHLHGRGLEFGALHSPLRVDDSCEMTYADHFLNEELYEVFPEIKEHYGDQMVDVTVRVDLNRSDLSELEGDDFDFFVANGVMEHLANPLLFLANVTRIMRPGSLLYLAVPDRDYAFDSRREVTPFEHLWDEYERRVAEVDDDHILDYVTGVGIPIPDDPDARAELFEQQRRHTIHVHVWDEASFADFLRLANERVPLGVEQIGGCGPREGEGNLIAVLRKLG
jgi:SAM-dependent methyltransferase